MATLHRYDPGHFTTPGSFSLAKGDPGFEAAWAALGGLGAGAGFRIPGYRAEINEYMKGPTVASDTSMPDYNKATEPLYRTLMFSPEMKSKVYRWSSQPDVTHHRAGEMFPAQKGYFPENPPEQIKIPGSKAQLDLLLNALINGFSRYYGNWK